MGPCLWSAMTSRPPCLLLLHFFALQRHLEQQLALQQEIEYAQAGSFKSPSECESYPGVGSTQGILQINHKASPFSTQNSRSIEMEWNKDVGLLFVTLEGKQVSEDERFSLLC